MLDDNKCPDLERFAGNARKILVVSTLAAALFWNWSGALSILFGGLLAMLNDKWMRMGLDRVLRVAGRSQEPPPAGRFVATYLGRLVLILLGLFAIIYLSFLSLLGALLGLSIFVLAGFLEVLLLMRRRR